MQGDQVFVFDPALGVARAVTVKIVGEDGDRVIVQGELSVTQRVIRDAVVDGERVQEIRQ